MFRHVVLFRVRDHVTDPEVFEAVERLRALENEAGAVSWRVELSLDTRKGRVIIEDATFSDRADFVRFRELPEHRLAGEKLAAIADWSIGDYFI